MPRPELKRKLNDYLLVFPTSYVAAAVHLIPNENDESSYASDPVRVPIHGLNRLAREFSSKQQALDYLRSNPVDGESTLINMKNGHIVTIVQTRRTKLVMTEQDDGYDVKEVNP